MFSEWLKSELARREWTSSALANAVGVSPGTVSRWLNGVRTPDYRSSQLIAHALEIPERVVLTEAGHLPSDDAQRERLLSTLRQVERRIDEIGAEINRLQLHRDELINEVRLIREDLDELAEITDSDDPLFKSLVSQLDVLFPTADGQDEARRRIHRAVKRFRTEAAAGNA